MEIVVRLGNFVCEFRVRFNRITIGNFAMFVFLRNRVSVTFRRVWSNNEYLIYKIQFYK